MMNADGSNQQHVVYASCVNSAEADSADISPDGTKIVAEVNESIAIMNADGTNFVQLTGADEEDAMPTFTSDGQHIVFDRFTWANSVTTEGVYVMNLDGTGITKPYEKTGLVSFQPLAVGDRIVFSTNADYPGTDEFELYSIMPDGSGLTRLTNNTVFDGS
jgi:TolB protein